MLTKSVLIAALGQRAPNWLMKRTFSNTQIFRQAIKNHQPNDLERRFLVWSGKYKTTADVPSFVSQEVMERCRNKMRIMLANVMIGLTVIGCGIMIYSGKQAAKRGESVTKQNLEWHKQFNETATTGTGAAETK
ncbi:UPF0389 protein GA21628 [Drosophila montana]|uniref:UPF0389 protein GA21628 n=1 Tax=Drosophila montana TaxID=40370 RepID=UPI00313E700D